MHQIELRNNEDITSIFNLKFTSHFTVFVDSKVFYIPLHSSDLLR